MAFGVPLAAVSPACRYTGMPHRERNDDRVSVADNAGFYAAASGWGTGDPVPVMVRVQWDDGTESEVNGWTSQWTTSHVCVVREFAPPYRPFGMRASDVRRRETKAAG